MRKKDSGDTKQFFHERGNYIKKKMDDFYLQASNEYNAYCAEAYRDSMFEAGDQNVFYEVHPEVPVAKRKQFNFNRIRRLINIVSGFQRRNRKSTIVIPVENGDQQTADQYSKVMSHINRKEGVLETISDSFNSSIITGMSMLYVWNDYRKDPVSGSLKVEHLPYNSFLIDPFFKRKDLSDCNHIWKRSYMTKAQILSLMPDMKKEIESLNPGDYDEKFQFMPESASSYSMDNLMSYDEYYYMDTRKQTMLVDVVTGETMDYKSKEGSSGKKVLDDAEISEFLRLNPDVTVVEQDVPTVKMAIMVNGTMLYDGANPLSIDRYPFVPVLAYFKPDLNSYSLRVQGMVRGLRDPQYLYNRRKAIEDDILSSQVNSGFIYKEDALVDPDDIFMAGQGKGIAIKNTAQLSDVIPITPGQIPPSMFQLSEQYAREIMEISGANEELLGSATDDKAGVLAMLRQGAGLTTLQPLFDNLDHAQKLLGTILLESIQANYSVGKVKRIIEEEPTDQFHNKAFGIYDAAIEEGNNTTTQRQAEFAQLLHLREIGVEIPSSTIIEASTIQNKSKLIESIEAEMQQAQEQQAKIEQMELELKEAEINKSNAQVESDLSLAKERDSRVFSNIGLMEERQHEAEKDKTQSMLNLIKTLQEMDSVTIDQLTKLVTLSTVVENQAKQGNHVEEVGLAINKGATQDVPNVPTAKSVEMSSGTGNSGVGDMIRAGIPDSGQSNER
jgi:hypothetical protein